MVLGASEQKESGGWRVEGVGSPRRPALSPALSFSAIPMLSPSSTWLPCGTLLQEVCGGPCVPVRALPLGLWLRGPQVQPTLLEWPLDKGPLREACFRRTGLTTCR